jgi:hypothetical protein
MRTGICESTTFLQFFEDVSDARGELRESGREVRR